MQEQDSDRTETETDRPQADREITRPKRQRKGKTIGQEETAKAEEAAPTLQDDTAQEPAEQEQVAEQPPASEQAASEQASEAVEEAEPEVDAEEAEETAEGASDLLPDGLPVREVIEALLFATDSPLAAGKIAQVLEQGTSRQVRKHVQQLNEMYDQAGAAFRIEEVAGGYQMLTLPKFQPWLTRLLRARQESRLSPTQMETLAIVAYKQPVLRADVEVIRGVAAGDVINRLRELGLVKIVGRAEDVGRPLLYGTTKKFLRVFGLGSLDDLPRVEELKPPEPAEAPKPADVQLTLPSEPAHQHQPEPQDSSSQEQAATEEQTQQDEPQET